MQASRKFYEILDFEVIGGGESENYLILRNGEAVIGLFYGMLENNIITFNLLDARTIEKQLKVTGLSPDQETDGEDGPTHLMLTDPDGNLILMDHH